MTKKNKKIKMPLGKHGPIKSEIKEMLKMLGISKKYFKQTMPSVSGSATEFVRVPRGVMNNKHKGGGGHKPSLKQQWMILRQLITTDKEMRGQMEEQKEHIMQDQGIKSAMQKESGEEVSKEQLEGLVSSVFDRDH